MLLTSADHRRPSPLPARPWAPAVLAFAAAVTVVVVPLVNLPFLALQQTWGVLPVLTATGWVTLAVRLLRRPQDSRPTGVWIMAVSVLSWFTATFGGLGVGMLLGLTAGSLAVARRPSSGVAG
ncbi:DUF6114 domain-containing protein [Streptomyces sp. NBC_00237]|uniref:DUF6114 domain-containing protein n=1 Tax=Streptomyces sp. NBC_00237 TaxID=2975687 RepID=UPI0022523FAB|nr:DUF6114 domain-containing protein [Streptomyces sp. NBC_00237]MCX5205721.1 DUF6114 domain-containing protein [Streptomyces sp. NBC_00237]